MTKNMIFLNHCWNLNQTIRVRNVLVFVRSGSNLLDCFSHMAEVFQQDFECTSTDGAPVTLLIPTVALSQSEQSCKDHNQILKHDPNNIIILKDGLHLNQKY